MHVLFDPNNYIHWKQRDDHHFRFYSTADFHFNQTKEIHFFVDFYFYFGRVIKIERNKYIFEKNSDFPSGAGIKIRCEKYKFPFGTIEKIV